MTLDTKFRLKCILLMIVLGCLPYVSFYLFAVVVYVFEQINDPAYELLKPTHIIWRELSIGGITVSIICWVVGEILSTRVSKHDGHTGELEAIPEFLSLSNVKHFDIHSTGEEEIEMIAANNNNNDEKQNSIENAISQMGKKKFWQGFLCGAIVVLIPAIYGNYGNAKFIAQQKKVIDQCDVQDLRTDITGMSPRLKKGQN